MSPTDWDEEDVPPADDRDEWPEPQVIHGEMPEPEPGPGSLGPTPGSDQAVAEGCTCAVLDNNHGGGYMGMPGVFVMSFECPLHGFIEEPPDDMWDDQEWSDTN